VPTVFQVGDVARISASVPPGMIITHVPYGATTGFDEHTFRIYQKFCSVLRQRAQSNQLVWPRSCAANQSTSLPSTPKVPTTITFFFFFFSTKAPFSPFFFNPHQAHVVIVRMCLQVTSTAAATERSDVPPDARTGWPAFVLVANTTRFQQAASDLKWRHILDFNNRGTHVTLLQLDTVAGVRVL
jgi:hypothetical protein